MGNTTISFSPQNIKFTFSWFLKVFGSSELGTMLEAVSVFWPCSASPSWASTDSRLAWKV